MRTLAPATRPATASWSAVAASASGRVAATWSESSPCASVAAPDKLYMNRRRTYQPPPSRVLDQPRLGVSLLALVVILAVIPQATTAPNQTGLTRIAAQPDLARPNWTVENRRLAVIS
jgi:hypothetical protein